jgi:uncharacterized protein (UPF0303 family)
MQRKTVFARLFPGQHPNKRINERPGNSMSNLIDIISLQERELVFESFTNEDALQIGNAIIESIKKRGKSVAVEITVNGWQVFKYAMDGTTPENDRWMKRKRHMLEYMNKSTLLIQKQRESKGRDLNDIFLDPMEYTVSGGAFPINLRGRVIGSIIVSGLPDTEDHQTVVDALSQYLGKSVPSVLD